MDMFHPDDVETSVEAEVRHGNNTYMCGSIRFYQKVDDGGALVAQS